MKFGKLALAASAASLAFAPSAFAAERVSAPVEGESAIGGGGATIAILFALFAAVIFVVAGDSDEPVSP